MACDIGALGDVPQIGEEEMKAWYFAKESRKLRYGDNRSIVLGQTHSVDCKPILCEQGLHGSTNLLDALSYAPGNILYLVNIEGNIGVGKDKICGERRTYLAGFDAEEMLREAARLFALDVVHLIKPYATEYDLIVQYLTTGDKEIRAAAEAEAEAAAEAAAWSAAWSAAGAAAWAAAGAAGAADAAAEAAWAAAGAAGAAEAAAEAAAKQKQANTLINLVYKYYPSIEEVI